MQKKKGHVSLQNVLPAQKGKKRGNVYERGRQSVSTLADNAHQAQCAASQQTTIAKWAEWRPYHGKPTVESFIYNISNQHESTSSLSPSSRLLLHFRFLSTPKPLAEKLTLKGGTWGCELHPVWNWVQVWYSTQTVNKYLIHIQNHFLNGKVSSTKMWNEKGAQQANWKYQLLLLLQNVTFYITWDIKMKR